MPERYISESLLSFPGASHQTAPLAGIEADIYNGLWTAIISGKLKSGTKLREEVIGETFGVSRTVTRKVLFIMEQEGIIELPANRGAYVATPTREQATGAIEAARVLTVHIVSTMASPEAKISAAHLKRIRQHIALQAKAEQGEDFAVMRIISREYFMLLGHVYGNQIIAVQLENLMSRVSLAAALYQRGEQVMRAGANYQEELLKKILDHDQFGAAEMVRQFFVAVLKSLRFDDDEDSVEGLGAILLGVARGSKSRK